MGLKKGSSAGNLPRMKTLTVDDYQRIRLPDVTPRQKFAYVKEGTKIILTLVQPVKANRARLVKVNGRLLLETDHPVTLEDTKRALEDFP